MEKINTEILVTSLFAIGFDKVDALLYTYTLGQLSIDNQQLQLFEFEDEETHKLFNKYVEYDGVIFKLKDGITFDSMASYNDEKFYPLRKMLNTNRKLIEYLTMLDFRKIIIKKIETLGVDRIDSFDLLFSVKEKEIMYKMFGMDMHPEKALNKDVNVNTFLVKNELVKRYIYLYQNKELILALCIGRGIEKEKIKSNIKKCKDLIKRNSVCRENEKLNDLLKSQIEDYYLRLKTDNYYLMSRVNKDIVSMFEDFLFSDDMMENSNLYKHIEAVKLNRNYLDAFNYSIELLEERRQTNIQLRNLPTFTVWRILSYVRRNNKGNKKILNALDKYYNLDRFIIAEDDCTTGYYMTESDYEDKERYYKYPNDMIIADGIITKPYKNCFEEEDNYFDECPILDENEKYTDSNISKFLEVLANMPTLDIETKRSVRRKIIGDKVLMK